MKKLFWSEPKNGTRRASLCAFLIVALLLMHNWFFDLAPGYRLENRKELADSSDGH